MKGRYGRFALQFLLSEDGSVETGLTLIPVMILFLSVLQLPVSALSRIAYSAKLQSNTYLQSFIGLPSSQNYVTDPASTSERITLPGGGSLLIKNQRHSLTAITPLLLNGDQFENIGISIDENN
mgnify:FL=1